MVHNLKKKKKEIEGEVKNSCVFFCFYAFDSAVEDAHTLYIKKNSYGKFLALA